MLKIHALIFQECKEMLFMKKARIENYKSVKSYFTNLYIFLLYFFLISRNLRCVTPDSQDVLFWVLLFAIPDFRDKKCVFKKNELILFLLLIGFHIETDHFLHSTQLIIWHKMYWFRILFLYLLESNFNV